MHFSASWRQHSQFLQTYHHTHSCSPGDHSGAEAPFPRGFSTKHCVSTARDGLVISGPSVYHSQIVWTADCAVQLVKSQRNKAHSFHLFVYMQYALPCHPTVMPSSHRRQGQDKTVGGVNWIGDKPRQFSVVLNIFETGQFCRVWHFETGQNCLHLSPIQFTPPTGTSQVLSRCPCRRCETGIRAINVLSLSLVRYLGIVQRNLHLDWRENKTVHNLF